MKSGCIIASTFRGLLIGFSHAAALGACCLGSHECGHRGAPLDRDEVVVGAARHGGVRVGAAHGRRAVHAIVTPLGRAAIVGDVVVNGWGRAVGSRVGRR